MLRLIFYIKSDDQLSLQFLYLLTQANVAAVDCHSEIENLFVFWLVAAHATPKLAMPEGPESAES